MLLYIPSQVVDLDFFCDSFPRADVIILGMILHDCGCSGWGLFLPVCQVLVGQAPGAAALCLCAVPVNIAARQAAH